MPKHYECLKQEGIIYPPSCVHPPELYKYPRPQAPITLLFLGWNPPKPYGGFWSLEFDDSLRMAIHRILTSLNKIASPFPDQNFLNEFLDKGYYFIHTVKCWSQPKFPGFGRDAQTMEGRHRRAKIGLPLLHACVGTHLPEELKVLNPQKVCALGELPFLGLCDLYPKLLEKSVKPTQGQVSPKGLCGLPWRLLYTCFPKEESVLVKGTKQRKKTWEIARDHLEKFL